MHVQHSKKHIQVADRKFLVQSLSWLRVGRRHDEYKANYVVDVEHIMGPLGPFESSQIPKEPEKQQHDHRVDECKILMVVIVSCHVFVYLNKKF
jgi:hypothetical protein